MEWLQLPWREKRARAATGQKREAAAWEAEPEDWHRARSADPRDPLRSFPAPGIREHCRIPRCRQGWGQLGDLYVPGEDRYSSAHRHFPAAAEPLQAKARVTRGGPQQAQCWARPRLNRTHLRTAHERPSAPTATEGEERRRKSPADGASRRRTNERQPLERRARPRRAKPLAWHGWRQERLATAVRARRLCRRRTPDGHQQGRLLRDLARPARPRRAKPLAWHGWRQELLATVVRAWRLSLQRKRDGLQRGQIL